MRTIVKAHRRIKSKAGVITDETTPHILLFDAGGTCVEDRTTFRGKTDPEKLALTPVMPAPASGYYWAIRNCSSPSNSISIVLSKADFVVSGSDGDPIDIVPPVPGDPASYGLTSSFNY